MSGMPKQSNIFLVGFMGSGKSTVGPLLAKKIDYHFVDSDELVEQKAGKSVAQIFSEDGEPTFRKAEESVIQAVFEKPNVVCALGGGALKSPRTRELLRDGLLVLLECPPEVLMERVKETDRPILRGFEGKALLSRIESLLEDRQSQYDLAEIRQDTDQLGPSEIAESLAEKINSWVKSN